MDCSCAHDGCDDRGCAHGCAGACAPARVDRRRFIVATSRLALGAAIGLGALRDLVCAQDAADRTTNSLGMELTLIAPGTFRMGSEDNDDEKPAHDVTLTKPISDVTLKAIVARI